jgi:hypothetical protein
MSTIHTRVVAISACYVVIFLAGFWLAHVGRPFGGFPLNLHKFTSLATVVLFVLLVVHANRAAHLSGFEWIASAIAGLTLLAAIVSGGVVTAQDPAPAAWLTAHRIAPYVAAFSTAATLVLFWIRGRLG